jgi:hypothetical protein
MRRSKKPSPKSSCWCAGVHAQNKDLRRIKGAAEGTDLRVFSLHAPEVECIGKGKAHRPYEFGVKVSVAATLAHSKGGQFIVHARALPDRMRPTISSGLGLSSR